MAQSKTLDHLYCLNVTVKYEHGSMRDTGTYEYRVLLPAADDTDAGAGATLLVSRYHFHHLWWQGYYLRATLIYMDTRAKTERMVKTWSLDETTTELLSHQELAASPAE